MSLRLPLIVLAELREDSKTFAFQLRGAHDV